MKGVAGYGRYDSDLEHVGCPRAKSDMTPCIARDGHTALADDRQTCVGCGATTPKLLRELRDSGAELSDEIRLRAGQAAADMVRDIVRSATEPEQP